MYAFENFLFPFANSFVSASFRFHLTHNQIEFNRALSNRKKVGIKPLEALLVTHFSVFSNHNGVKRGLFLPMKIGLPEGSRA